MPDAIRHGGSCCGMFHIRGFSEPTYDRSRSVAEWDSILREQLRLYLTAANNNRVAEITLNDMQCRRSPNLLIAMGQLGFKPVTRFRNTNSYNNVTVFHRIEEPLPLDNLPFVVGDPNTEVVRYRRVYRNGRRSGTYDTREAAEAYKGKIGIAHIEATRRVASRLFG